MQDFGGMELKDEVIRILTDTRDEIRANMSANGINASGRTSASIRVLVYDGGVRLVGGTDGTHAVTRDIYGSDTAPIPTLEIGREGGKVPRGFYHIIKEWSREKGLQFNTEGERSTFAYFVAQKIAREGTRRHMLAVDVYSTPVNKAVGRVSDALGKFVKDEVGKALRMSLTTTTTERHF